MAEPTEISIRICGRREPSAECSEIGCRRTATGKCTEPLKGKRAGQTCGRALCDECGGPKTICPPHQRRADSQTRVA